MGKTEEGEEQLRDPAQLQVTVAALRRQLAEKGAELDRVIEARRRLEKALQEAEHSGQNLVENLSDVIYSTDEQGVLTYLSPVVEHLLGYEPSEATGRHIREFVHHEDLAQLDERFQQVAGGEHTASEFRVLTKSGEVRWMRTSSQPVFDGGRVVGVQGVLTDITEHKQAEEQIQDQNKFLMSILESLTHPFYVLDAHDYTIHVANTAARFSSLTAESTCYALTHRRDAPCDTADHPCPVEVIKRTKAPTTVEHIHYDEEGRGRPVEVHGYPLFDDEGNVVRIIEYSFDITERKQAEEALRESEARWRSITVTSPDHVILLDRELCIQFVNYASPGLTVEELIGTPLYRWVAEERQTEIRGILERVLATAEPTSYETDYLTPDGDAVHYDSRVVPRVVDDAIVGLAVNARDITQRKHAEEALRNLTHALGERVKELNCLFGLSQLSARRDITLEELLQGTVELLPPAFQYPEATCARIIMEDQEFRTAAFEESRWRLDSDLLVSGERIGAVEVHYLAEKASDEVPFLAEERKLINAVAERLGKIVEQIRAEKAVRQRELEYRQLLNALQEGIWVIDEEANTTFVNPRMAEMLGYRVEEMLGKHLYFFMDERGIEITERNLARRAQGIREQHDFEFLRKDGSRMHALLETSPVYDDDGNYAGAIAGIQDITDRRVAERALRRSETLLNETQQMAKLGGWELDLRTSEVIWTDEVYRIHEVPAEFEPTLENALEFYHPQDRPMLEQAIQRSEETGEPWDLEMRFITAKGKRLWVRAIGSAERHNGQVVRLAGTFQDITERKQGEQALEEAAAVAERNRLARDLHDSVTQALFSASLVAEVLPQVWNRDPEAAQEGLDELRVLTRSALAEMRTMLLELRPATLVETRLNELLRQLTEAITSRGQLQVTFNIEPSPALPPEVHITFYRITQEALNNAVKHAGADRVTVSLQASPPVSGQGLDDWQGQVTLRISDDGRGFDAECPEAGQLGLRIMRERAESIGADLEVDSRPGRGTEITLFWP